MPAGDGRKVLWVVWDGVRRRYDVLDEAGRLVAATARQQEAVGIALAEARGIGRGDTIVLVGRHASMLLSQYRLPSG